MVKFSFYVPFEHLDAVKTAMFDAGAGRIGNYQHCAWQVPGRGQFRPSVGSDPYIGSTGELVEVDEYLVEMVCRRDLVESVVAALKSAHPYEEPAYGIFPMLTLNME